ncbi:hypothetical protein [Paraburkholderia caribensis]|uniref:hypothetical protein n=1 Tax=Paraburkholderia caribensis TaxID=75105 RepID=UPI0031E371FE
MRLLDSGHSIGGRLNSVLIPYRVESVCKMFAWMMSVIDESGEDGYTSFAPFEISKRLRDFGSSCCARARLREMKALISSPVKTSIWSSGRAHADEREAPIVPRMDELA